MSNATSPRGGTGSARGICRRGDIRLDAQDFEQPFRRAGRLRDLAPHLTEFAERTRCERSIENELAEPSGADLFGQDVMRADPQDRDDAGENQEDHRGGKKRARARRIARSNVGSLDFAAEPRFREAFVGEGLQRADRTDEF